MLGILLGLGAAMGLAAASVITRRGMLRASSNYFATISVFTGFLFFVPVTGITGDLLAIGRLHWKACIFWALSGIVHFALGRTWAYRSVQLVGTNRSNIVTSLSPIATVTLAVLLLREKVTPLEFLGIMFTLSGPLLILLKEKTAGKVSPLKSGSYGKEVDRPALILGVLYGLGAALFWGSSSIFIKFGLDAGGTPVAGTLIAYTAASAVISPSAFCRSESRREICGGGGKELQVAILAGLVTSVAQLLRYLSLGYGSVIVPTLMIRTMTIWVLLFAFVFNRELESFSRWVLLGNILIIAGTILIIIP